MAKQNNENKVVYAALTLVLTVLSILVIVTGVATRRAERKETDETEREKITEKEPDKKENSSHVLKDVMADPVIEETEKEDEKKPEAENEKAPTEPPIISDEDLSGTVTEEIENVNAEPTLPEFICPADGEITKNHSETVLVFSNTMGDYRTHSGIDILTGDGGVVVAAADGIVAEAWEDPMWGYCISIGHEGDAVSYYKNLSRESINRVKIGEEISAGDVIGNVGDTALYEIADESHLHFELKVGGVSVDPLEYFEAEEKTVYED